MAVSMLQSVLSIVYWNTVGILETRESLYFGMEDPDLYPLETSHTSLLLVKYVTLLRDVTFASIVVLIKSN